jgi:hypothetical protein
LTRCSARPTSGRHAWMIFCPGTSSCRGHLLRRLRPVRMPYWCTQAPGVTLDGGRRGIGHQSRHFHEECTGSSTLDPQRFARYVQLCKIAD